MIDQLINYYEQEYEEDRRLSKDKSHRIEFLTTTRYFDKVFSTGAKILDACAGTGAYAFHLAQKGYKVTAGDIVPYNVSLMEKKQAAEPILKKIYTGSILELSEFEDNSFDVVLCMGALYHLHDKTDREKAIQECRRVLRKEGILATSYINRHAVILHNIEDGLSSMEELLDYKDCGTRDVFYSSTPKEIINMMKDAGFETLYNIGTDGIGYMIGSKINNADDNDFRKWLDYHFSACEEESLLGYSLHGLYFGRKVSL